MWKWIKSLFHKHLWQYSLNKPKRTCIDCRKIELTGFKALRKE
jgi:hypothetical protein